jgi:hypothetical protein
MVCHDNGVRGQTSRVTLSLTESHTSTIGVAGIPLNRDDVTDV